mgnify:FL=1
MSSKQIFLSLGSNIGDRQTHLRNALSALESGGVRIVKCSSLYETEPQQLKEQPWFLNIAVEGETPLFPMQLLHLLLRIEHEEGRKRGPDSLPKGPRTLDIDILLYSNVIIDTPRLTIPHPRLTERRFVLEPLVEIAPQLRHPVEKESLKKALSRVSQQQLRNLGPWRDDAL